MAKKANPTPSRTCADCFHFSACHLWAVSISTDVAPKCPQFEPARYASLADLHEMHQMARGELVPVVRCMGCRKRQDPRECPMCFTEVEDIEGGRMYKFTDLTRPDGFCHMGAKEE